jgi:hypothetical protein
MTRQSTTAQTGRIGNGTAIHLIDAQGARGLMAQVRPAPSVHIGPECQDPYCHHDSCWNLGR